MISLVNNFPFNVPYDIAVLINLTIFSIFFVFVDDYEVFETLIVFQ